MDKRQILDAAKAMDEGDVKPAVSLGLQEAGHYTNKNFATGEKWYRGKLLNLLTQRTRPTLKVLQSATRAREYAGRVAYRFNRMQTALRSKEGGEEL